MGFLHGAPRHAAILFPARRDDDRAEEPPGRFLDALVDRRTLTPRGVQRAQPAGTGRPASDPAALLPRSMSGALSRLRARRRLAPATHRHGARMWRLQTRRPAHQTRAAFRQHPLAPLRQVCRELTWFGTPLDRCAGARVALDGRTGKAVNATERHVTPARLAHLLPPLDQRVAGALQALDGQENHDEAGTPGGLSRHIARRRGRRSRHASASTPMGTPRERPAARRRAPCRSRRAGRCSAGKGAAPRSAPTCRRQGTGSTSAFSLTTCRTTRAPVPAAVRWRGRPQTSGAARARPGRRWAPPTGQRCRPV